MGLEEVAVIAVILLILLRVKPSAVSDTIRSLGRMAGEFKKEYDKASSA